MRRVVLTLSLAALSSLPAAAHADTLFDNYNEGQTPPYSLGSSQAVIQTGAYNLGYDTETAAFFSPASDAYLTSLTLAFSSNGNATGYNVFNFSLRADDNSGLPGTVLESWTNVTVPTLLPNASDVTLTSILNPHLLHADTYWIVASAATNTSYGGWYTNSLGTGGNSSPSGYLQLSNEDVLFGTPPLIVTNPTQTPAFKVEGSAQLNNPSPVPTPATALAALPLMSLLAANSLRKRLRHA